MKGEPDLERNRLKLGPALERKRPKEIIEVLDIPQRQVFEAYLGKPERER